MFIAAGTASRHLSQELARITGTPLLQMEIRRFPDREAYVRVLDPVDGEDVVIVSTAYPDKNIIETILIQDAVIDEAKTVTTVIPYLGYSRQDRKFLPGEAFSARAVIRSLTRNTDHFAVVNLHKESVLEFSDPPSKNILTYREIASYLSSLPVPPDMILAPDKGARHIAEAVAGFMDREWDYLEKHRIDGEHVEMSLASSDVKGKSVAIVDDIISTGGTIATAAGRLREKGAREVYAVCTHGLFIGRAREKLGTCTEVASSDTIETGFSRFSASPAIADYLREIGILH